MAQQRTTPWKVTIVPPRTNKGEVNLYLRARRLRDGRQEEQRVSAGTLDPRQAERERERFEADLNSGGQTVPKIMDARIADLQKSAKKGLKSERTVIGFQMARQKLATVLDVEAPDSAAVLSARDELVAEGLGAETINSYLRRAAAAWRWAEERKLVTTPWPKVKALPKPPNKKRPYTPAEVAAVLEWVSRWQGGVWYPLLCMVDDTGRRVGEVCVLRGLDLDRRERTVRVVQKGQRDLLLPVSEKVMALIPERGPNDWLFPRPTRTGKLGPARVDAVRSVIRKAIKALGIPDGERLDTHSLRRSFCADAHRAGVADDVTRRLTGHETQTMLMHYQRETVGDDLREAQDRVRAYRSSVRAREAAIPKNGAEEASEGLNLPKNLPSPTTKAPRKSPKGKGLEPAQDPCKFQDRQVVSPNLVEVTTGVVGEGRASPGEILRLSSQDDAAIAILARWWDECPAAMRRFANDAELRALFLAADQDLVDDETPSITKKTIRRTAR